MRIGVLGGSFDPPHLGHIALAECARDQLHLDLVIFAVAGVQWQKSGQSPAADRLRMTQQAVLGHDRLAASDVDLVRGGDTTTIDTMTDIKAQYPDAELWFLMGADALAGMETWRYFDELVREVQFAAAPRVGEPIPTAPAGCRVTWLECELPAIAARDIRSGIASGKLSALELRELVPAAVADEILASGRYR